MLMVVRPPASNMLLCAWDVTIFTNAGTTPLTILLVVRPFALNCTRDATIPAKEGIQWTILMVVRPFALDVLF